MVNKDSSVPLYLQIQQTLQKQIDAGEYGPGTQVPSEQELSNRYSVSRMTARKALDGLVSSGMLYRRKGKGTFVVEDLVSYGFSTMQSFSRTLGARGYEVVTKVLQQRLIPGTREVLERLNLAAGSDVIVIRRLRFVEGTATALHTSFMDAAVYQPLLELDMTEESLLRAIEDISGVPIAYTRDSVRAALVGPDDARLLEVDPGSPVLKVEGVAYTPHGQPNRLTEAVYRADYFKLVVTNVGKQSASFRLNEEFADR